ncbi:hypothetical protein EG327_001279 [Venturia inaequalis]|uniref:BTB domain-containing protein n=1 Tax=Venturia inaequalis TaxID=5025 RepID=A0A8H3VMT2_VENIN|nr:hypothetical protein EG327_001279 [Venturia inaequalis]
MADKSMKCTAGLCIPYKRLCKRDHWKTASDTTTITIIVGRDSRDEETFTLLREDLNTVSEYFENVFLGASRKAMHRKAVLTDVKPATFKIFAKWLNGKLILNTDGRGFDTVARAHNSDIFKQLLDLYVFADRYDVPQLRREVLDTLVTFSHFSPTLFDMELVAQAYDELPADSPFLRFLIDEYAANWSGPAEEVRDDTPVAFLWELTKKFCDLRSVRERTGKIEHVALPSESSHISIFSYIALSLSTYQQTRAVDIAMADSKKNDKAKECTPCKRGYRKLLTDNTMVTITVGKDLNDELEFVLPQQYLITVSEFFENSFAGSFLEAKEKRLTLSDVKPTTFRIFVEWLNGRKLLNSEGMEYDGDRDGKVKSPRFEELVLLYIFADQYDVPQFRRDVLETFATYQRHYPMMIHGVWLRLCYDRLPSTSPMLRFLVDSHVYSWTGVAEGYKALDYSPEFLWDLASKFCSLRKEHLIKVERCPYELRCDYHEHDGKME